ncbi:MAG: hypothetical protein OXT65_08785 [Alphaproteobacteria bacterium]|nr:hypothetical protein [Alphaproteobacteria bacterium]
MTKSKTPRGRKPARGKKTTAQKSLKNKEDIDLRRAVNALLLIEALEQHVLGEKEMTATQVSAALALLKKTLPDISAPPALRDAGAAETPHEDALDALE